jgi:hypothetical protein
MGTYFKQYMSGENTFWERAYKIFLPKTKVLKPNKPFKGYYERTYGQ